jgi:hypothetical protein
VAAAIAARIGSARRCIVIAHLQMQKSSHEHRGATKISADVNEIERLINEI